MSMNTEWCDTRDFPSVLRPQRPRLLHFVKETANEAAKLKMLPKLTVWGVQHTHPIQLVIKWQLCFLRLLCIIVYHND